MKILGGITLFALVILAVFAAANWTALAAPASLNFLVFSMQGPLGLILLCITLLFALLFSIYAVALRTSALVETRRHLKQLEAQRALAEEAEASRFTSLTTQVEQEFARVRAVVEESRADVLRRVDGIEQALAVSLSDSANSIAAHVGQVDDKLDRLGARIGGLPSAS